MIRKTIQPRTDWQKRVEEYGFTFHSPSGEIYWDESHCYELTEENVDTIETATQEIYKMALQVVQHVIDNNLFEQLKINPSAIPLIKESWDKESPSIYMRLDLSYDGKGKPKLLEINADTPTSLFEAAIAQYKWLQEFDSKKDQFNSIHEKLVDGWRDLAHYLTAWSPVYFSSVNNSTEDYITASYMMDTAYQAFESIPEMSVGFVHVEDVSFSDSRNCFVNPLNSEEIKSWFKLYPWEWLIEEILAPELINKGNSITIIEPAWKLVLSNKGILPIFHKLFPNSPYILPAYYEQDKDKLGKTYVKKPFYSREGANITIIQDDRELDSATGEYGEEGFIYQEYAPLPKFDDAYPVIGSWIIAEQAAGIGIREDSSLITKNTSRFVPHYFV